LIKMDSKELRNLHEAYMDVYAPQENIEEGLRSAVKRLLGGGKKEAESSKPESRGEQLRKKYNVGPEKSDTSAKRQILDRSRAKAEKDEKDYGDKPFQKQVAQKSKAAHDRYLKAGYSKYGADDATGRGSKAAKRAAALNKEEFEIIVNALIEEGYDLSSYTWDEMYEVCLDEAVKGASRHDTEMRKAASTERKSGIKNRLSPAAGKDNADKMQRDVKFFDKLTKKNRNVVGLVTKEEVEGLDEGYMPSTQKRADKMMKQVSKLRRTASEKGDFGHPESEKKHKQADKIYNFSRLTSDLAKKRDKDAKKSEFNEDIYDIILSHLIAEGYADTNESALVIMANMSEEWRQSIVEVKMDPRGRPASGPMNVYKQSKPNNDPAFQAALKSVRDADAKKTPEQRKAELDAYKERQMNR
jgi:hypothetical protein